MESMLACCYCGDTMDKPTDDVLERFGPEALVCCGYTMIELDTTNLYKLAKGLELLKCAVENEITKDF